MTATPPQQPRNHRRRCAAWAHVVVGGLLLACVAALWAAAAALAPLFEGSFVPELFTVFGRPIAIALLAFGGLEVLAAFGLMRGQRWAVHVLVGVTVFQFLVVPLGTALAVFHLVGDAGAGAGPRRMKPAYRFTFETDWRHAPLAFWVHAPVPGTADEWVPPAPRQVPHQGYRTLRVDFETHELLFSAPAQLDHFIEVLSARPLPTSRQLCARRGLPVGPNGHWLSRLPAALKSPRRRARLVQLMRTVREQVVGDVPARWAADR